LINQTPTIFCRDFIYEVRFLGKSQANNSTKSNSPTGLKYILNATTIDD